MKNRIVTLRLCSALGGGIFGVLTFELKNNQVVNLIQPAQAQNFPISPGTGRGLTTAAADAAAIADAIANIPSGGSPAGAGTITSTIPNAGGGFTSTATVPYYPPNPRPQLPLHLWLFNW
jgi:hypothetical protein